MSQTRLLLGPFVVAAERWPAHWHTCAKEWLLPAGDADSAVDVRVTFAGYGVDPAVASLPEGSLMRIERTGDRRWLFRGPHGTFVAELDDDARELVVHSREAGVNPWLALGNPLRGLVAQWMPKVDGLMVHAAAGILRDGSHAAGIVACGISGAGKSTLANGFRETVYLTDDVSLVRDCATAPRLIGSPFFGAAGYRGPDLSAPLRAIAVLVDKVREPSGASSYERVSASRGAYEVLRHVARFTNDPSHSGVLFGIAAELCRHVPVILVRRSLNDSSDDVVRAVLREAGC